MNTFKIFSVGLTVVSSLAFADDAAFMVSDIPKESPIEGQLGEPGAPALKEQQAMLATALLSKGLCNEDYYGVAFCARQATKSFTVAGELKGIGADTEIIPDDLSRVNP